jgi:hypothetical protein
LIDNGRAGDAAPILQKGLELNPGDNIVSIFPYLVMHLQISIRSDRRILLQIQIELFGTL